MTQPLTPEPPKRTNTGQVQSLIKALKLMKLLAGDSGGQSLKVLATKAGYPPSTTHRLLSTLQDEGFVRFDGANLTWSIGVSALTVGNAFIKERDLVQIARPHMRSLMQQTGETVNLAVPDRSCAVYLAQVESRQMMRAMASPGTTVELYCSAVGKLFLSEQPLPDVERLLNERGMPKLTKNTLVTTESLLKELEWTRTEGAAIDDEEHLIGLRCVAAPIRNELGQIAAAISVSAPAVRVSRAEVIARAKLVKATAARISGEYGGGAERSMSLG